ncbi:MAG: Fpg/Nei family DNA glycosylase [Thermoleophilia bacterium]|nr:Fpg/Nei family DNA glycosylase [Thermoleophilia bacterium]
MPELPDVETFRRYLGSTALHKTVEAVLALDEDLLEDVDGRTARRILTGVSLDEARRHGKRLFVCIGDRGWLVLHFGMTGELAYYRDGEPPAHTRLLLAVDDGYHLAFTNQRKFGSVSMADDVESYVARHDLGPDALEMEWPEFREALEGRRGAVKSTLMDQSILAGVGNVYADETCFQAHVRPDTKLRRLDTDRRRSVYRVMRRVLTTAIDRQADPDALPRTWLIGHRHEGDACPRCGGSVARTEVGGRSTYYCPDCQPAE